jgi:hypothetical protein
MAEQFVKVRPAQSDAYLANPHKGCCTFQHFNGDELYPGMEYSEEGLVELSAGLIDPQTQEAKVSFANKTQYSDRWLHLGKFEVV